MSIKRKTVWVQVQDAATVFFPTITAEKTTVRARLSSRDCVTMNNLTIVTVSEREKETGDRSGTLLWVGPPPATPSLWSRA
jgi:hypothetical protein